MACGVSAKEELKGWARHASGVRTSDGNFGILSRNLTLAWPWTCLDLVELKMSDASIGARKGFAF